MRALLQRVTRAEVAVHGEVVGQTGPGFLVLFGAGQGDHEGLIGPLADKLVHLRVFADDAGRMNRSLLDMGGAALVVSQFTLYADCRKGRRPSFTGAAPPGDAERLYEAFVTALRQRGVPVQTGRFGADMQVSLCNDGPVTLWLDSAELGAS